MLNTWGDPLTDALQADKAARDRELEEARRIAREWIAAYPWPGGKPEFFWDGEHFMCCHSSGSEPGCPGCLDGSLHRVRKAADELEAERDQAREAAREMLKRLLLFAAEAQVDTGALRSVWEKKHSWLKEQP